MLMSSVDQVAGRQGDRGADHDQGGEEAQEERVPRGTCCETGALDAERLGDGVGRWRAARRPRPAQMRRAGRCRRALGGGAGDGLERLGGVARPRSSGPVPPMAAAVAMMIAMETMLAKIEPLIASTSRGRVLGRADAPVGDRGGLVELHVGRDGGADQGDAEEQESRLAHPVRQQEV